MKIATPLAFLATISGACSLIVRRDTPLKQVVQDVLNGARTLEAAAQNFDGGDIGPVLRAADGVIATVDRGQRIADGVAPLDLNDAASLLAPVLGLNREAKSLLQTFKKRVDQVEIIGQCDTARTRLEAISFKGTRLIDTLLSKIADPQARDLAQVYADNIKSLLGQARQLFAQDSCINA